MSLKIEHVKQAKVLLVKFSGAINEDAVFSPIDSPDTSEIMIYLDGITSLNSCGIREWIRWISALPPVSRLVFVKCPKVVVDQMNMVEGFLPKMAIVHSMYVPYFCDSCENTKSLLFSNGQEFAGKTLNLPKDVKCEKCGNGMEIDAIPNKYFKFLQARG